MVKVSEIFVSIQGEGRFMGQPCIFLRLHGCNLRCSTCDTKYAIHGNYERYSTYDLAAKLSSIRIRRVVVTGGEPLLQKTEVLDLVDMLSREKIFLLETNGTIFSKKVVKSFHSIAVSPKRNSKDLDRILEKWAPYKNVDFKFVIGDSEWCWSFEEVLTVVERYNIRPYRVWLMPEGSTSKEIAALSPKIWNFCVSNHFNYSDRLHIRNKGR